MNQSKMTYQILINPSASKGRAKAYIPIIEAFFKEHNLLFSLTISKSKEHAQNFIKNLVLSLNKDKNYEQTVIVGAGGDGTCNEVITGMMKSLEENDQFKLPYFGFIPIGSGNDFAKGSGLPENVNEALNLFLKGETKPIDIGSIKLKTLDERFYFANGIGAGFDTQIVIEAEGLKKRWKSMAYQVAAIKLLAIFPSSPLVSIEVDGETRKLSAALISIMNGQTMGGGFKMAPQAIMDDGLFNLCTTARKNRLQVISALIAYARGKQNKREDTTLLLGTHFKVKAYNGFFPIHADGEILSTKENEFSVTCYKNKINLICP